MSSDRAVVIERTEPGTGSAATPPGADEVGRVFHREWGRAVASLVRVLGDIDAAEDAVQDAFEQALRRWPESGIPPSPAGWIITTARNRAIDRFRRESSRGDREREATVLAPDPAPSEEGPMGDDRLRLIFTCCHPALSQEAQVALTLRLVCGLATPEIARAFLVPEATLAQRLVRAKTKIRAAKIPYRVPEDAELPPRLRSVLLTVYLVFDEGYLASTGDALVRDDLAAEAIRLARLLVELMPDEEEAQGLLALLLLTEARRPARVAPDGSLVRLADQDRSLWRRDLMAEGQAIVRACLRRGRPGPYQVQAAIAAVHSDAPTVTDTDWGQVVALYDQLLVLSPTPVVELNRAIAVAELAGPRVALGIVDELDLDDWHLFHTTRAELLARLGRADEARSAYDRALAIATNAAEMRHIEGRRAALG